MSGILSNFKNFMLRGQIINYIIGVCVGASYAAVVSSLVNNLIMPLIYHYAFGDNCTLANQRIILRAQAIDPVTKIITQPEVAVCYGNIISSIINFFIIASSVYLVLRVIETMSKRNYLKDEPASETRTERLLQGMFDMMLKQEERRQGVSAPSSQPLVDSTTPTGAIF
jgi:large conductance mechanosensitive channel